LLASPPSASPASAAGQAGLTPTVTPGSCANGAVALLGAYDASDGRIVVLRFAPGCATGGPPANGATADVADTLGFARLSPAVEAALAAKHAGAAAQSAAQAAKPSRRETIVALATAVAVLLLK
jgi:hypothetical protein